MTNLNGSTDFLGARLICTSWGSGFWPGAPLVWYKTARYYNGTSILLVPFPTFFFKLGNSDMISHCWSVHLYVEWKKHRLITEFNTVFLTVYHPCPHFSLIFTVPRSGNRSGWPVWKNLLADYTAMAPSALSCLWTALWPFHKEGDNREIKEDNSQRRGSRKGERT